MDNDAIQQLRKEVRRAKRIASERASELHDLVEDRLPTAYQEIPQIAEACYQACQNWEQLNQQLEDLETD
ncbi:CCE_0567 family metalloprotein [Celerinatantimonas sp. YJH-8]|uniref:CCE_0567 family metalloprotein n=1 Tax=Celerinatantimonas sp. YJH-8 TaxID=3228714 RepID=UPI0038CB91A2